MQTSMKANYLLTLAAGLLMAGCAQNELTLESPDANPPVSFDVYTGVQTRGPETLIGNVQSAGFGIFAYYTGQAAWASTGTPNYMYNQKATYAASAWSYAPVKYWPNKSGDKVTFFAYAPYNSINTTNPVNFGIATCANTNSGNPYLDFTIQTDPSKSVDLVTAEAKDQVKQASAVGFTFNHVLSRAKFSAKTSENLSSGSHVFIKSVKILGSTRNSGSKFYSKARYTFSANTWDYTTTGGAAATAALQTDDYDLKKILNFSTPSNAGGYNTSSVDITSTTAVSLFKSTDYFFFIPVANATGTAADNVKVEIEYDVVTVDNAVNGGHTVTSNSNIVSLPSGTLKKGTAYNFIFEVDMNQIKVTATTVNGWGNETSSTVTPDI